MAAQLAARRRRPTEDPEDRTCDPASIRAVQMCLHALDAVQCEPFFKWLEEAEEEDDEDEDEDEEEESD